MKKEAKVEYGITITKPWSKEMYDHNDEVAEVVKAKVLEMWNEAFKAAEVEFVDEDELGNEFTDMYWEAANEEMVKIQKAITYYSFTNQNITEVAEEVVTTLENMPTFQLRELVEELEIELEKGFVGFN
jgi:glutamine synthetase